MARRFTTSLAGPALTAAALLAMVPMYAPRPWLLTVLFFIGELYLLIAYFADGRQRRLLWLIPLFVLWANIHIQFTYGLLVLALAAAAPTLAVLARRRAHMAAEGDASPLSRTSRLSPVFLWELLIACAAATLLTPYGWRTYQVVYEYASQPAVFNLVTEFHAPAFRSIPDFLVLLMTMATAAALARTQMQSGPMREMAFRPAFLFDVLLLVTTAMLSFRCVRDTWCVVIVAVALLAKASGRSAAQAFPIRRRESILAAAILLLTTLTTAARHLTDTALQQRLASVYPVQAAREVQSRHLSGPLFNHFNWGGYLIWSLPELRVSMDGRTNVHGDKRIARSVSTWNGDPGWQRDPELLGAGLIIAAPHDPLFLNLREDKRFQLVYHDQVAGVFVATR